jgi:hypothetical protein
LVGQALQLKEVQLVAKELLALPVVLGLPFVLCGF